MESVYLVLCNIRSAYNVGSIFRTADAVGVRKIFLCGTTPCPVDRFGRKRKDVAKVALGAEESIIWEQKKECIDVIRELQKQHIKVIAVEQHKNSIPYTKLKTEGEVAFVFGEETKGIPNNILDICDVIVEIPMNGKKESLNVSVSAGVVLFRFVE